MKYPLGILAPTLGAPSETFIRRHMEDLAPGRTIVGVEAIETGSPAHWQVGCPTVAYGDRAMRLRPRVVRFLSRRIGLSAPNEFRFLCGVFQRHGVEVILGEWLDFSVPCIEVANAMGIRFFGHAHGIDVSQRLREPGWSQQYLKYNEAAGVIAMSSVCRTRLIELGLAPGKIHVVPYGVPVPARPPQRHGRGEIRCLAVGRMVAKKAPILVLDAFRRAADAHPALRLDYVGAGPLLPAARQFVQAFGLQGRVTLLGAQSNDVVQRLMHQADLFIQHSMTDPDTGDEEGLPVAILEAMAQALPVVSTRHAGIPEAVEHGTTGYLVEEGNSDGMGEYIVELARDPQRRLAMGHSGWHRASVAFSWEGERLRLLDLLGLPAHWEC